MLNFNVAPYYDDFDPNKHFHRILFKPGKAVQARELTQSQSILQDQISKFASHIFAQNTPISGGSVTINRNCYYLKLNQTYDGIDVDVNDFLNRIIMNTNGTILAKVVAVAEANIVEDTIVDPPTLIVSYITGKHFTDSTVIYSADDSNFVAKLVSSNSSGKASTASIADGVFYVVNGYSFSDIPNPDGTFTKYTIGNFVSVQSQTILLDKYDNAPSVRIGLNIYETIHDYVDDVSLLDPALGASNYQAPGADRYVIILTLETRPLKPGNDDGFIELVRIEDGNIRKQVDSTVYSVIDDYFAKRTYDTNGDYIVEQFKFTPKANTANSEQFFINIGKGIAYVRGYRIENQSGFDLKNYRARSNSSIPNNIITTEYGNYFYVTGLKGSASISFDVTKSPIFALHCVPSANVNSTYPYYNSTMIGLAKVRNIEYTGYNDSTANTDSLVYKLYLADVETYSISSNVSSVISDTEIAFYDNSNKFSSVANAYVGMTISFSTGDRARIISYNGSTKRAVLSQEFLILPTNQTTFTISFDIKDTESLTAWSGTALLATADIDKRSKVGLNLTKDTILNNSYSPELLFKVGYPYVKVISDTSYQSKRIFRNVQFTSDGSGGSQKTITIENNLQSIISFVGTKGSVLDSGQILSNYIVMIKDRGSNSSLQNGSILDFSNSPRSISLSSDGNSLTFSAPDLNPVNLEVDIITKINISDADDNSKILKLKTLIKADSSSIDYGDEVGTSNTFVNLTTGQVYIKKAGFVTPGSEQTLYISDVKRIVKIIDTKNKAIGPTIEMLKNPAYDVSSKFNFNNGQTDSYYNHAFISLKSGATPPVGNLLILVDYYQHSGGDGYFSIMSYEPSEYKEIGSYVTSRGQTYKLRDCLDFRPVQKNVTTTGIYNFSSGTNSGAFIPEDLSNFVCDYSFYLGRKDLLVLSKDRSFQFINGVPSINPVFPQEPEGALLLAKLTLDPYTAYIPGEAPTGILPNLSLETIQHKRWTMKDISDLQTRVNNIEYYTSLSMLEQKSQTMQIPDVNGLNRFKNGILVDDFSSYSTADTGNQNFSASINFRTNQMTARHLVKNFPLQTEINRKSFGKFASDFFDFKVHTVNKNTNIFTLPYTTANVVKQELASNTININPFNVVIHQGVMELTPPMDNWIDTEKAPDLVVVDPNLQIYQQTDTVNSLSIGDWKVIPGTKRDESRSTTSSVQILNHQGEDWGYGIDVGVEKVTTTTTTATYASSSKTDTSGSYTKLNNTYNLNNSYLTDVSIIPYIRGQEILVEAVGMAHNTPLTITFDGIDVSDYMHQPDTIELINVTGTFKKDDIIGFYENEFYPIATVVSVYRYKDTSKVRLSVVSNFHCSSAFDTKIIQNALFDKDGNYLNSTAFGSLYGNEIITIHKTGNVSGIGGYIFDENLNQRSFYDVSVVGSSPFADSFAIWSNPNAQRSTTGLLPSKFNFSAPTAGSYYLRWVGGSELYGYVKINGNVILGSTTPNTRLSPSSNPTWYNGSDISITLLKGTNNIEFNVYNIDTTKTDAYFGLAIANKIWKGTNNNNTKAPTGFTGSANVVFSTTSIIANSIPSSAGTLIALPAGGTLYSNVYQFMLNGAASGSVDYYVGSKIKLTALNVTLKGKTLVKSSIVSSANIISYSPTTKLVTVDNPVSISLGYNGQYGNLTTTYTIDGIHTSYAEAAIEGKPCKNSTDEDGNYVAVLHLPDSTFRTGERVLRIDNRTVPTDPSSATTFAEGTFVASGLHTKTQSLSFGSSISGAKGTFTRTSVKTDQQISYDTASTITNNPWDPLAQTFIIDKENFPLGIFLSSISLFFKSKPGSSTNITLNTTVSLKLVGTKNGYPDGEYLDYGIKTLKANDVKISDNPHYLDSNTKTTFTFDVPIYIQPGVLYAFILQSDSDEYNVYIASQDAIAIPSTVKEKPTDPIPTTIKKIGSVPYVGHLFESQNSMTWIANPGKAMMMVIDRCVFKTSVNPTIPFWIPRRLPYRKSSMDDLRYSIDEDSAKGKFADTNIESHAYNITTTDFMPTNTKINYYYNSILASDETTFAGSKSVVPGKFACPNFDDIYLTDGKGPRKLLCKSNTSFILECDLSSKNNAVSPILCDDGLSLYNIEWKINNLELDDTQFKILDGGSGYTTASVVISPPDLENGVQAFATAEVNDDGEVSDIILTEPGSGYLQAPTITIFGANTSRASVKALSEFNAFGGNADCKYISKKVVLVSGNDSQDLRVYYTAYRPQGTSIYVFYKLLSKNDPTKFDSNKWQLMTTIGDNKNAYSKTRDDLFEFEAAPGTNGIADGFITYTNQNGNVYKDFIQFAIKIVLTTSDKTYVPFLTNIRAIALPSYSGM